MSSKLLINYFIATLSVLCGFSSLTFSQYETNSNGQNGMSVYPLGALDLEISEGDLISKNLKEGTISTSIVPVYDLSLTQIVSPKLPIEEGKQDITIQLYNNSNYEVDGFEIVCYINGQNPISYFGSISAKESLPINIGSFEFEGNANYQVSFSVRMPDEIVDDNPANNEIAFTYLAENYDYYNTDRTVEVCNGENPTFTPPSTSLYEPPFDDCHEYSVALTDIYWTINDQKVSSDEELFIISEVNIIVQFHATLVTYVDASSMAENSECGLPTIITPQPITYTYGLIVNDCNNIPQDFPNCKEHAGKIFYDYCNDELDIFIKADGGLVLDPIYVNTIDFNYFDGQSISFDYETTAISDPCSVADQAVIITCIEEVDEPLSPSDLKFFETYPWLYNVVDPYDCAGTVIRIYKMDTYYFLFVEQNGESKLYLDDGSLYCKEASNFSCLTAYGLGEPDRVWYCGEDDYGVNPDGEVVENIEDSRLPIEIAPRMEVFPNPSAGIFTLQLDGGMEDISMISVYNTQGQVVTEILGNANNQYNLAHLNDGIYFLALQYGFKTTVKKLVIRK